MPIFLYFLSATLSLVNSDAITFSSIHLLHILIIFFGLFITTQYVKTHQMLNLLLMSFLILSSTNGISVILPSFSSNARLFGFAGVMYVDYAAISMIICIIYFFTSKGKRRFLYIFLFLINFWGLMVTQTRNPLLVLVVISPIIISTIYFKANILKIKRSEIRKYVFFAISIFCLFSIVLVSSDNPMAKRITTSDSSKKISNPNDLGANSILTRILIWDTAINAFKSHPIVGIGAYSFPLVSEQYCTFSNSLYDLFVKGLAPHVAYLMAATETGIIGLLSYILILICSLLISFNNIKYCSSTIDKRFVLIVFALNLYLIISSAVTDAWLFGHGIVFLSLVMGLSASIYQMLLAKSPLENSNSFQNRTT